MASNQNYRDKQLFEELENLNIVKESDNNENAATSAGATTEAARTQPPPEQLDNLHIVEESDNNQNTASVAAAAVQPAAVRARPTAATGAIPRDLNANPPRRQFQSQQHPLPDVLHGTAGVRGSTDPYTEYNPLLTLAGVASERISNWHPRPLPEHQPEKTQAPMPPKGSLLMQNLSFRQPVRGSATPVTNIQTPFRRRAEINLNREGNDPTSDEASGGEYPLTMVSFHLAVLLIELIFTI